MSHTRTPARIPDHRFASTTRVWMIPSHGFAQNHSPVVTTARQTLSDAAAARVAEQEQERAGALELA